MSYKTKAGFALAVIFAINTMNFFDRQILGAVGELIRKEWSLSDTALGTLGTAFTLIYAVVGLPLGRLSDKFSRRTILAWGVLAWSALTAVSGLAQNFFQMFIMRLGVGVGEATCAPAANSMIGDLYPASRRSKALSVFMLGLPVGIALSFAVSGIIAKSYGWRMTFYVAGIPGILCAIASFMIPRRFVMSRSNISNSCGRYPIPAVSQIRPGAILSSTPFHMKLIMTIGLAPWLAKRRRACSRCASFCSSRST